MVVNKGRRSQLRRKYLSLGLGELFAVTLFIWVVFLWSNLELFSDQERSSFLAGSAGLVIVLTQAGMYWLLARSWVELRPMPRQLARLYRLFQVFDVLVLLAAGAYIAVHLPRTGWAGIASVTVWLFAVVEFVNYYMVRLSYPWTQWLGKVIQWRTPRLVQDLRSGDRTVA